ncbi:MAG: hypothetical protein SGPRY_013526, partial [Prymnesium sp.]
AARDDRLWRDICASMWPSLNRGRLIKSYLECYQSANGWLYMAQLPHSILTYADVSNPARRGTRSQATQYQITAFDADDSTTATALLGNEPSIIIRRHDDNQAEERLNLPTGCVLVRFLKLASSSISLEAHGLSLLACTDEGVGDISRGFQGGLLGFRPDNSAVRLWDIVTSSESPPWPPDEFCFVGVCSQSRRGRRPTPTAVLPPLRVAGQEPSPLLAVRTSGYVILRDVVANTSVNRSVVLEDPRWCAETMSEEDRSLNSHLHG